jgi:hypothetical protein
MPDTYTQSELRDRAAFLNPHMPSTASMLRYAADLAEAAEAARNDRTPCEACGAPSDGFTRDDVPLCHECGTAANESEDRRRAARRARRLSARQDGGEG